MQVDYDLRLQGSQFTPNLIGQTETLPRLSTELLTFHGISQRCLSLDQQVFDVSTQLRCLQRLKKVLLADRTSPCVREGVDWLVKKAGPGNVSRLPRGSGAAITITSSSSATGFRSSKLAML